MITRVLPAFIFVLALGLSAPDAGAQDKGAQDKGAKAAEEDPLYATVNGEAIRRSTLEDARSLLPDELQAVPTHTLYPALLNQIINSILIAEEARRRGYHESKEMKQRLKRITDQILERAFLVEYIEKRVTEESLQKRYKKLVEDTQEQSEVHARHILVKTEKEAQDLIGELKKGADFVALAKKHSTGPSGANGGDLGYFRKGQMVKPFSEAAFAMEKGDVSKEPVRSQFGWHVIKVEDRRAAKPPAVEDVREKLVGELSNEIGNDLVQKLREKAKIEVLKSGKSVLDSGEKKK